MYILKNSVALVRPIGKLKDSFSYKELLIVRTNSCENGNWRTLSFEEKVLYRAALVMLVDFFTLTKLKKKVNKQVVNTSL